VTVSTAVWARREIRERRAGLQFDRFNKRESSGIVSTDALFIDLKVGTHLSKYDSQTGTETRPVVSDLDQRSSRLQCRRLLRWYRAASPALSSPSDPLITHMNSMNVPIWTSVAAETFPASPTRHSAIKWLLSPERWTLSWWAAWVSSPAPWD
jgi:hypothetical protein